MDDPQIFGWLILLPAIGLLPAYLAWRNGHSFLTFYIFGALFFIIALPMALFLKLDEEELARRRIIGGQIRCPHCDEFVSLKATICPHCRRQIAIDQVKMDRRRRIEKREMRCPACNEFVNISALVCPYCSSDIRSSALDPVYDRKAKKYSTKALDVTVLVPQLEKLTALKESGALTDEELAAAKRSWDWWEDKDSVWRF